MSKEEWLKKFEKWQPSENKRIKDTAENCKDFEKAHNGYCKNYIGCKILNRTCCKECMKQK